MRKHSGEVGGGTIILSSVCLNIFKSYLVCKHTFTKICNAIITFETLFKPFNPFELARKKIYVLYVIYLTHRLFDTVAKHGKTSN